MNVAPFVTSYACHGRVDTIKPSSHTHTNINVEKKTIELKSFSHAESSLFVPIAIEQEHIG